MQQTSVYFYDFVLMYLLPLVLTFVETVTCQTLVQLIVVFAQESESVKQHSQQESRYSIGTKKDKRFQ